MEAIGRKAPNKGGKHSFEHHEWFSCWCFNSSSETRARVLCRGEKGVLAPRLGELSFFRLASNAYRERRSLRWGTRRRGHACWFVMYDARIRPASLAAPLFLKTDARADASENKPSVVIVWNATTFFLRSPPFFAPLHPAPPRPNERCLSQPPFFSSLPLKPG